MKDNQKSRERIERYERRLANMKAKQLVNDKLEAKRAREARRRADALRKMALGSMLMDAGVAKMEAAEILGALLSYRDLVVDLANRERYRQRGANWLGAQKPSYLRRLG